MNDLKEEQKDQETINKLLPAWRKLLLSIHETGSNIFKILLTPVTWFQQQIDGTADWKALDARLDEDERKKRLALSQAV